MHSVAIIAATVISAAAVTASAETKPDADVDCDQFATTAYEIALLKAGGLMKDGLLRYYPGSAAIIDPLFDDPAAARLSPTEVRDLHTLMCRKVFPDMRAAKLP